MKGSVRVESQVYRVNGSQLKVNLELEDSNKGELETHNFIFITKHWKFALWSTKRWERGHQITGCVRSRRYRNKDLKIGGRVVPY